MQAKKKTVALIEAAAGNVDSSFQKSVLTRYAEKHNLDIDNFVGDRTPREGAAGQTEHRDLLNNIREGGVGMLLVLSDARHAVPEEILEECRAAGATVKFVDVQEERGLTQTS
jgi:hypothetical protein